MKKYLIIGDGESPHTIKWARELSKYFEVYLVSSKGISAEAMDFLPDERIFTFNLKITESGTNVKFIRMLFPLIRIIGRVQPDYVNAHYITSYGVLSALVKKLRRQKFVLIQSAWGTDILVTPFRNTFYKRITRFALNSAVLVTSDSVAVTKIIGDLSSTPTTTFPFGLQELPEASWEMKSPNLFFSNRTLNENSNIDRVLHFFSKVKLANKDARMIIAHEGPLKENLIALSNELGLGKAVEFIGFITEDQQNELYRRAQFYFSLLTSDALSVSLLEALSFGCIPILSDLPDNREWINDGENGIILKENTELYELNDLQGRAKEIFTANRVLIESKAIFPKAINDFCQKLKRL